MVESRGTVCQPVVFRFWSITLINWQRTCEGSEGCLRSWWQEINWNLRLEGSFIRLLAIVLLIAIVSFFPQAPFADSWNKTDHLFRIERSINRNFVQFDVRLMENSNLPDSSPVIVYWVLENGQQEELTPIQQKYAYGIHSQEKIEENKFRVILAALKGREIIVEKINGSFRALVLINGIQSILERVYIESKPRLTGLPNVLYIDLFGRIKGINSTNRERIILK